MSHSILILDDDRDFNCLLTDIFKQADYDVTSLEDPYEAIELFKDREFELVVTDHRMPGISGKEFMEKIKVIRPGMPVIMVSGYLDNDMIRELIGADVSGVFLKPLNIFSLLERTAALIQESEKSKQRTDATDVHESLGNEVQYDKIGFNFRSFPCRSEVSLKFAKRIFNLKEFTSTLTLVGESGTHYQAICEDICGFSNDAAEQFIYFSPSSFDADTVLSKIEAAGRQEAKRVTCVLIELEQMSETQKLLARELAKGAGTFESIELQLRTIFCVNGDIDLLMDDGLIDENLYMLMGTSEVVVPALRSCPEDIPVMAQRLIAELVQKKGLPVRPRFNHTGRVALQQLPLNGNFEELSAIVAMLLEQSTSEVLTEISVQDALTGLLASSPRGMLEKYLGSCQQEYAFAVQQLFKGDRSKVAQFFGTELAAINSLLN